MKKRSRMLLLVAASMLLIGATNTGWADAWVWFTAPVNGSIRYLEPGQSGIGIFVNVNFTRHPYPFYDWKTKIKIDEGGWQEDIVSFTTAPLSSGLHYFSVELWENQWGGGWMKTGVDYVTISIVPKFNVTIKNDFPLQQNGTNGQIKIGDWTTRDTVVSPFVEALPQNNTKVMEAFNQDYQAPSEQNYFRVYQSWSKDGAPFNSTNPAESYPVGSQTEYRANFAKQFNVSISLATYVEPGNGGTYKVNGTNIGSTWQGTFLQYTVTPITLEAVPPTSEWLFVSWSDGNTSNPRSLIPTGHTSLFATFKMRLASTAATATASNSQRLMASGANDVSWMVYPSAGELWWNYTADAGATWWYDTKFTNSSGTASAPSLAIWTDCVSLDAPCYLDPYVVYRTESGGNYNINFCILNTEYPQPIPTSTQLNAVAIPTSIDTRPVVARLYDYGSDELWAFWQGATSLNYNYAYKSGSTWGWMGEQAFLNGFKNPSLSAPDLTVATPNWYLTYDNGNDVYILTYPDYTLDVAVPASVGPTSFASQVSADNRTGEQVHVVWEAFGEYVDPPSTDGGTGWKGNGAGVQRHRVMYQKWNGTGLGWGAAYEFKSSTLSYYRPTVSNLANGHVAWAWDDGSTTYKALYNGTSWSVTETFANTIYPNLGTSGSAGMINSSRFVSTSTTGPPYRLNVGAAASRPDGDLQTSVAPGQYSRKVIVARNPSHKAGRLLHQVAKDGLTEIDSSSYLSVELAPIMLKLHDGSTVTVDFPSATDSTMDERSVWGALASTPVMLTSAIDSVFIKGSTEAYAPLRLAGRELGLAFDVVDAEQGTVLRRIGAERVFNADSVSSFALRGHLAGLAGRRVFLRPSIRGFEIERRNLVSTLVHVYTLLDEAAPKPSVSLAKSSDSPVSLPTAFALHPNYPNPFNPTTEIRFDLPDAGNVSLVVYDVLGREVAALATGYQEAGYHSATWNAGSVASGVYFARFNVINAEGKVAFSKINKLVLMK